MKKTWTWAVVAVAVIVVVLLLAYGPRAGKGPADGGGEGQPSGGKVKVAATIYPLADIVANVGGEKVDVVTIMPAGASPHTFEVTPDTVRAAQGARALFKIGCGLDDWAEKITAAMGGDVRVVEVSQEIDLRKFEDGSVDPHYWLSLKNGQVIAVTVARTLSSIDASNGEYYMHNMTDYVKRLEAADAEIAAMLAPVKGKSFVTFHEAWFYFAQEYGLNIAAAFEPFPGRQPTPAWLAEFEDAIRKNNVKWIFSEPQFSDAAVSQVAKDLNVKLGVLDPEGGVSEYEGQKGYIPMMKHNAETIRKALEEQTGGI